MKRFGLLMLISAAACSPNYTSGKTQCSTDKLCPSGFVCVDDGTSAVHYCVDDKTYCDPGAAFYCSQSKTCWAQPGVCSTVAFCGTAKHPTNVICASANYHPDCNGDACLPNGTVPDSGAGGAIGYGGATVPAGVGGSTLIGVGGALGTGGMIGAGGGLGTGGRLGTGGSLSTGGSLGTGGRLGTGGSTVVSSLCSGTPYSCSVQASSADCALENGCTWYATSGLCSGTPSACSSYTSATWCYYNGCSSWTGSLSCTPTPLTTTCSSAASASTDTCSLCLYNSCCGQLMNCINDTDCSDNSSGPAWNAYIDCTINCCGTTCGFI